MSIIGIDLGSSFADLALLKDGAVKTAKVACDGLAAGEAILTALDRAAVEWGIDPAGVREIRIGSTGAVNMLLTRQGASVGLITNRGFGDTLTLARQNRADLYDPRGAVACAPLPGGAGVHPGDRRATRCEGRRAGADCRR